MEESDSIKNKLIKLNILLTSGCNLRCLYCKPDHGCQMLFLPDKILDSIQEFYDLGVCHIGLIGGEPLLYPNFYEFLVRIKKFGIKISLHSNLTLLNNKNFEWLSLVDNVFTCINGPSYVNDKIRGKGVYEKTVAAIKLIKNNYNVQIIIDYIITKLNSRKSHVDYMLRLADELRCKINFQPVFEHSLARIDLNGLEDNGLSITQKDIMNFYNYIMEHYSDILYNAREYINSMADNGYVKLDNCQMGKHFFTIDVHGDVVRCYKFLTEKEKPNGFKLGWKNAFNQVGTTYCSSCFYAHQFNENCLFK